MSQPRAWPSTHAKTKPEGSPVAVCPSEGENGNLLVPAPEGVQEKEWKKDWILLSFHFGTAGIAPFKCLIEEKYCFFPFPHLCNFNLFAVLFSFLSHFTTFNLAYLSISNDNELFLQPGKCFKALAVLFSKWHHRRRWEGKIKSERPSRVAPLQKPLAASSRWKANSAARSVDWSYSNW